MSTIYTPTVGELIKELEKFPSDSKVWFSAESEGTYLAFTPVGYLDNYVSYKVSVEDSAYGGVVSVAVKL